MPWRLPGKLALCSPELLGSVMVKMRSERFFFFEVSAGKTSPHNPGEEIYLLYPHPALLIKMFSKTHSDIREIHFNGKSPESWPQVVFLGAI